MENVLNLMTITQDEEKEEDVPSINQASYPHRICDITLPQ